MPEDPHVDVGRLRWLVQLATRVQAPAQDSAGIAETIEDAVTVYADIQAVGGVTFWGSEQIETPVTHRIFMRWHDYLDRTKVVLRATARADGSMRTEIFAVRRIKELGGRKRFAMIEAELEKAK